MEFQLVGVTILCQKLFSRYHWKERFCCSTKFNWRKQGQENDQYTRLGRFWQVPNSKLRIGTAAPLFYRITYPQVSFPSQELQIPDSQSRIGYFLGNRNRLQKLWNRPSLQYTYKISVNLFLFCLPVTLASWVAGFLHH